MQRAKSRRRNILISRSEVNYEHVKQACEEGQSEMGADGDRADPVDRSGSGTERDPEPEHPDENAAECRL